MEERLLAELAPLLAERVGVAREGVRRPLIDAPLGVELPQLDAVERLQGGVAIRCRAWCQREGLLLGRSFLVAHRLSVGAQLEVGTPGADVADRAHDLQVAEGVGEL